METLDLALFNEKIADTTPGSPWKLRSDVPVILDFYADWCGPCRAQAPILEEIAKEYAGKVAVYKVNVDKSPELASMFRIRGIPALLFIPKEGRPSLTSGLTPKEELRGAIQNLLFTPGGTDKKSCCG